MIFLQFFTNVVLIASFLGMSCGCLLASREQDWLARFPFLALGIFIAAESTLVINRLWSGLAVDVGHQPSPQEVFFGTEVRNPDVAGFVVPIELIAGLFFVLVALLFLGPGQALGRALNRYPHRVRAYTLNIAGSLAGIAAFSAASFAQAPPVVWFLVVFAGIAVLLAAAHRLTRARAAALLAVLALVAVPVSGLPSPGGRTETRWSPYYAVVYSPLSRRVTANTVGHQEIDPFEQLGGQYSLIHLIRRGSGGTPFGDVLTIGSGSGNDLAHALRYGATRIDAVEIDPVIQAIGVAHNPDRPYQDPRVVRHVDDGRHFLRTTDRRYDLVVYGLVDSLILHSSYASIRLESYLFTDEAFRDVARVLKPGGIFVTYNFFRKGWIVERVADMAARAFGHPPIVIGLPRADVLRPDDSTGFTLIVAGSTDAISDAFRRNRLFWISALPPLNTTVNGFALRPDALPVDRRLWLPVAPSTLDAGPRRLPPATDDWPFLYVRERTVPDLTVRSTVVLGVLGLGMVCWCLPRRRRGFDGRMFFLGAAFLLLETKAVVQLALLFGSTWTVNALVFAVALVLILLANLYVLRVPDARLARHYAGLFALIALGVAVPADAFLGGGAVWRYLVPCALALGPMFFAGVIFARSFRDAPEPDLAFGANIAGSVVGGFAESCSLILGFRYLLLVAAAFYLLSALAPAWRPGRPA